MAKARIFDASQHLDSPDAIAGYLTEAFETGDNNFIAQAIGTVARAQGMTEIARAAGLNRENLYRALDADGHPEFETVMKVLDVLGVRLEARPKAA